MSDASKPTDLRALGLVLPYLRPYAGRLGAAAAAMLAASGLLLLLGQGLRHLIDTGFAAADVRQLDRSALLLAAVVAGLGTATCTRFYLVSWLGERVAADLRRRVFGHVLTLSPEMFETARLGDILARLTTDIAVLQALVGSAVSQVLRSALTVVGALAMLLATSARLTGIIVLVVPLVVAPMLLLGRREKRLARAAQDRQADLAATAEETVSALRTVQAFTHEAATDVRFGTDVERSVTTALARVRVRATLLATVILLGFGAITFALWVGGRDVVAGRLSGGDLSAFVFYAVLLASSGATASELWGEVRRAAGAADRVLELLGETRGVSVPARPAIMPAPLGRIAFEAVGFHYPARPDTPALDGFDLRVEPGETVALVGPSGAGKTTVFQLLLRFYDPLQGLIRVDGVDIGTVAPTDLRTRIALVPQDPVIFGADAWDNVRYGRPGASDAEVLRAVRAASAEFLEALPNGMSTFLGEKGVRLSGGQRQRVAIARAILRDAPILLLDEATSALDAESEAAVQRALTQLARGRTTLVIAHRLATVRRADRIVVLEGGHVVASGDHRSLLASAGLYARLAELQFVS